MKRRVYFIRPAGMEGPVKIGCSEHPNGRLLSLTCWSPFPLEIAVAIDGGCDLEARIQGHFAASHTHREWFSSSSELSKLIDDLQRGIAIHDAINLATRPTPVRKSMVAGYYTYNGRVKSAAARSGRKIPPSILDALLRMKHHSATDSDVELIRSFICVPPRLGEAA
jgi:hypothetical protein